MAYGRLKTGASKGSTGGTIHDILYRNIVVDEVCSLVGLGLFSFSPNFVVVLHQILAVVHQILVVVHQILVVVHQIF